MKIIMPCHQAFKGSLHAFQGHFRTVTFQSYFGYLKAVDCQNLHVGYCICRLLNQSTTIGSNVLCFVTFKTRQIHARWRSSCFTNKC